MLEGWDLVGRIMGALVALILVLLAAWMLLRWMNNRVPGMGGGGAARLVKVLDRVAVGRNSSILLLRVQDKVLLVAMTEHGAEKLCEFDDPDGTIAPDTPAGDVPGFAAVLKDTARKLVGKEPEKTAGEDAPGSQEDGGEAP